jgi:carbon-monoxide dehydrogenase small subunit
MEVLELVVNGHAREAAVAPNRTLLDFLREDLGLTGTKRGCDDASCGACTVLVEGRPHLSCIELALSLEGARILTIEGAAREDRLGRFQESLVREGGLQCGYCTPGLVLAASSVLECADRPGDGEIREALAGNLCRCTGYNRIVEAVKKAIDAAAAAGKSCPGDSHASCPEDSHASCTGDSHASCTGDSHASCPGDPRP